MKKLRDSFTKCSKKLRRARRLYGHLCAKSIECQPDIACVAAIRAKERGLYSKKTCLKYVAFSLCRHSYRVSDYKDWGDFGWHRWLRENGFNCVWDKVYDIQGNGQKPRITLRHK